MNTPTLVDLPISTAPVNPSSGLPENDKPATARNAAGWLAKAACAIATVGAVLSSAPVNAADIPFVYTVENTGANLAPPPLPDLEDLPTVNPLTDPFAWSDGSGRSTDFADWSRRRSEIKAEIEHYEIGAKPGRPDDITASYADNLLTVNVTVNGETLTLTSEVILPEGDGPFPAIIGIGRSAGSLPPEIFSARDIAQITFDFTQVTSHTQKRGQEPINRLYPDQTDMGSYAAWPWGASRLIDGLELVQDDLPIDLSRIAVSGCSFAGKMALFIGAFDERIALTIAQEPGGGGAASWRVSETMDEIEKLVRTNRSWFKRSMFQYAHSNVYKLPTDHHELMAMVAPRALFVLGNTDYNWLAEESGYTSHRAAQKVWNTLGIPDRFGFSIVGDHQHCRVPDSQVPELEAFVDKFLLGIEDVNTNIARHPFGDTIDYAIWTDWWGTGSPTFELKDGAHTVTVEAEDATVGNNWAFMADPKASHGGYVTSKPSMESIEEAPSGSESLITLPFTLDANGKYSIFWRVNGGQGGSGDSFWIKLDDGDFEQRNGLGTNGWEWVTIQKSQLTAGDHTLTIGYRENGAKLDKIRISTNPFAPEGVGQ